MKKFTLALITITSCNANGASLVLSAAEGRVRRALTHAVSNRVTRTMVKPVSWPINKITQTQFYKKHPWLVNTAGAITVWLVTKELYHRYQKFAHNRKLTRNQEFIAAATALNYNKVHELMRSGVNVNAQDDQGDTALMRAAENKAFGAGSMVNVLLQAGANVNLKNNLGDTALIKVTRYNRPDAIDRNADAQNNISSNALIIKELIRAGADIHTTNKTGETALNGAVKNEYIFALETLVKAGAQVDTQQLYDHKNSARLWQAVLVATEEIEKKESAATHELWHALGCRAGWDHTPDHLAVLAALNKGADFNARNKYGQNAVTLASIFSQGITSGSIFRSIIDYLLTRGARIDATEINKLKHKNDVWPVINEAQQRAIVHATHQLSHAISSNDPAAVRAALSHPYVNVNGNVSNFSPIATFPLLTLANIKSPELTQILLDAGANVNVGDINGNTTLMAAAERGRNSIIKLLIQAKADVDAMNNHGLTALMKAAQYGHLEAVKLLIAAGADVNIPSGDSALRLAAGNGYLEIVRCLIAAGADVNQELREHYSGYKETALLHAADNSKFDVMRELLRAGAEVDAAAINTFPLKDNAWKDAVWKVIEEHRQQLVAEISSATPFPGPLNWLTAYYVLNSCYKDVPARATETAPQTAPRESDYVYPGLQPRQTTTDRQNHDQAHGDIEGLS